MSLSVGKLVISVAGRDERRVFAVIGENEAHLILADGRKRRIEKPKTKKVKHVEFLDVELSQDALELLKKGEMTNKMLYRSIRESLKSDNS